MRYRIKTNGIVLTLFVFIGAFALLILPAEAVKLCSEQGVGIGPGSEKHAVPDTAGKFLTLGCGSVRDTNSGQEIACYHSLNGVVAVILKIYDIIVGIVGSLALLMFVWGGFQWLISGGSDKRITAGMTTLQNAVIGLVIVFGAWIGMNFVIAALNPGQSIGDIKLAGAAENWWAMKGGPTTYCYRPLSSQELAEALAKPVVMAPAPAGIPASNKLAPGSGSAPVEPVDKKGPKKPLSITPIPEDAQGFCCWVGISEISPPPTDEQPVVSIGKRFVSHNGEMRKQDCRNVQKEQNEKEVSHKIFCPHDPIPAIPESTSSRCGTFNEQIEFWDPVHEKCGDPSIQFQFDVPYDPRT